MPQTVHRQRFFECDDFFMVDNLEKDVKNCFQTLFKAKADEENVLKYKTKHESSRSHRNVHCFVPKKHFPFLDFYLILLNNSRVVLTF